MFFDTLGKSCSGKLKEVSADGDDWIAEVVHARCLNAKMTMDAFHTVQWATDEPWTKSVVRCGTRHDAMAVTRNWLKS
jgi:transposase